MSRYKDSNKYKIYGEDAILAARFDKYLDATLRNCRADYLKALSKRKQREIPYEDLPDAEKETVQESSAADDEIESLLFWEALKTHLHPKSGRPASPDCHDVPAGIHQYAGDDQPPQGCHGGHMDLL